ncbi:MAG: protein-export chaperone SecB [bacterium]
MPENTPPRLTPKKIYLKDASFESPGSPDVFLKSSINPNIEMNLEVSHKSVDEDGRYYEVVLQITATATLEGNNVFLVEVQQAGLFEIIADDDNQRELLIQVGCPHTLLPFAREEVANLVSKGGYQQMLIAPVNFESVYRQKLEQKASAEPSQEAH